MIIRSYGIAAAIAELFMQSTAEIIWLLPALPQDFGSGRIKGIRAKGRVWADISFSAGRLEKKRYCTRIPPRRESFICRENMKSSIWNRESPM